VVDVILTRGRGYEAALSVAKSVQRGVARGVLQEYGANSQSECPYRGNRWERERRIRTLVKP
jgi:hypothetical protein